MFSRFIERPVLAIVISVIITLLGLLAVTQLPMTQFPAVAPPEVNVTTEYTGANAETSVRAVITPLERAINGVPGMKYMSSDATNDGVSVVQIIFEVGTDPDVAAVNVQNRVAAVMAELPSEVIKNGVKIAKEENSMLMYLNIFSDNNALDEKFLYNFTDINILAELKRIKGVGYADIMGAREYAMRIWLKPDRMLAYNISADEVVEKLQAQNVEAAPGKLGESSDKQGQALQYVLKYTGKYTTEEEYGNIPLRANTDGELLRLKDLADIEFSTTYYDVVSKHNGRPSAAIMLRQLPGSNASEVIAGIKARMAELKQTRFAPGMDYEITYDVSRFLDASIHEVIKTLIEAFVLVALVVFLFLQDWRSTLIPAIAVPVALIGTFFFMQLFGFSINLITLFALVLAIGVVVDDSIVVVEAVHAKMEQDDLDPWAASKAAMSEIGGAVIAITLVMVAVFVPVMFLTGPVGIFFRQFAVTMTVAILISAVNALTLSPALCALILKNTHGEPKQGILSGFFDRFNRAYDGLARRYQRLLRLIINRRVVTFGLLGAFCAGIWGTSSQVAPGFIPNDDQGTFYASITTPAGATLERTRQVVDQIQQLAKGIPAIKSVSTLAGNNILSDGTGATFGTCLVNLKAWDERTESVDEVMEALAEKTRSIKGAQIEFFPPPAVPGYGNASGLELRLLDQTGKGDYKQMESVVRRFVQDLEDRPEIENTFTIFDASFPQYMLYVDPDKAAQKSVSVGKAMQTLQTLIGSEYATNFIRFGQMYKVMVQALPSYRAQLDDLLKLYVKNDNGEMVPFSAFMRVERVYGLEQATRYNMYPSAEINGQAAPDFSSGSAIRAVQEVAATKLPKGYSIDWAGISRDEVQSGNQAVIIFLICLVFVYLILSAQYESFLLPMPVILSLPTGVFGAFFFLWVTGLENNIYAQIAMVMLIGLLGKNAILIVEFANQRRAEGLSIVRAVVEGALARLRPILMTSFAFIAGLIPLCIATGAGAVGNRTIGTAAAGGMLMGTVFGLVIVPGLYVVFASLANRFRKPRSGPHQSSTIRTSSTNAPLHEPV
ncbi:efflux RND transporter permease subunit [Spirosoma sordidisoli]|uniref:Efflux RND transporter permease subunit n=1 Tax=Spirosoma sordidisoli TaxID=2502893 RepID=A0A4Q2UGJ4_9BACT|nr:efflux RND transporter permease subunit [Spirosoma sordidisoli]RYC68126.1 efflux RND transporter permease subunit [Spirosoma sordidisoli]